MLRASLILALALAAAPALADKEKDCALQGELVAAIQAARLDRVKKDDVMPALMEANPDWPEALTIAIPPLVEWVYGQKRRDLKGVDLGEITKTQCIENYDQIRQLQQNVTN